MTDAPDIHIQTFIRATPEAIWEALTDASALEAHHFNEVRFEPLEDGGHALLNGEGQPFIVERLIYADAPSRLELGFEPSWAEVGDEGSSVVFDIAAEGENCKITCRHYRCADLGIGDNWHRFMAALKSYLETGERQFLPRPAAV